MDNILIVGAKGNLGQAFAKEYEGKRLTLWDREELDITNQATVHEKLTALKPDLVINCAAYNAVDKAETEEDAAMALNGYAVGFLAEACKKIGATLVHYSTHYVFDGENPHGYNEDDKPSAQSVYGRSKILGEELLKKYGGKYYLIRTAWLYSNNKTEGKKSFIDIMIELAQTKPEVHVVDNEFGHPTWVRDLARATNKLLEDNRAYGIYHLTNEGFASWYEWAQEIFRIRKLETPMVPVLASEFPRPVIRPHYGILNNTKSSRLRPWQDALEEFLTLYN